MTEKEKMLNGLEYNSRDCELIELYHKAREVMNKFNSLSSRKLEERSVLLSELFEKSEEGVWVEPPFYCDYGVHISVGKNTFINANCIFIDNNKITIGSNCLIAPNVQIYTASHPIHSDERIVPEVENTYYRTTTKPVVIGNDVWIGGGAIILPGVTIGNGVTIGAGSVVTKDIPDNVLAFGNPCQIQKRLK